MEGYSGGEEKPLTLEDLNLQRGEALKDYQNQVRVLQRTISGLREKVKELSEKKKTYLSEIDKGSVKALQEHNEKIQILREEKDSLLNELQGVRDQIKERVNRRDSIQTNFAKEERSLRDQKRGLDAREKGIGQDRLLIEEGFKSVAVKEEEIRAWIARIDARAVEDRKDLTELQKNTLANKEYNEKMLAYWNEAKRVAEEIREENQKTLTNISEAKAQLVISEDEKTALEQKEKDFQISYDANRLWSENLDKQEFDLKLVDKVLDKREREISRREKLYKQAIKGDK
jgi:chromosome segregation ATPase